MKRRGAPTEWERVWPREIERQIEDIVAGRVELRAAIWRSGSEHLPPLLFLGRLWRGAFTTRRKLAIGVAGASVIGVVVGAVLGESAKGNQNDAYKLCSDAATPCTQADQSNALIKAGQSRALEANVAFGLAAAGALGAGVLWFSGAPIAEDPTRVSVVPHVAPGEAGVLVLGRF